MLRIPPRLILALLALGSLGAVTQADAEVVYLYSGNPLQCLTPGPLSGSCYPYGPNVFGSVTFDDTVVTAGFTGSIDFSSGAILAASLGTSGLGNSSQSWNSNPGPFVFSGGQIVDWYLAMQFSVAARPGSLVPVISSLLGERISPVTGGLVLGIAGAAGPGQWTRVSPVPIPAGFPLLVSGLAGLAAFARRRRLG